MKKMMTLMVMLMLVMSAVPAFADEGVDTKIDACIHRLEGKVRDPAAVCARIHANTGRCQALLEEQGVLRPGVVCAELGLTVAATAGGNIREEVREEIREDTRIKLREKLSVRVKDAVADYRVKRIERFQENHPGVDAFISGLPEDRQKVFLHLTRAQQDKLVGLDRASAVKELARYRLEVRDKDELFERRTIAKERREDAREKFEEAKERYQQAKDELKDARDAFEEARRDGDDEASLQHAKEYLLRVADHVIASLEKIKHEVEANEDLTDDEAAAIIAEIDARIAELNDAKAQVEAATTKEEVKAAAKIILKRWVNIKARFAIHVGKMEWRATGLIIERSAHLESRFDCAISALEGQGVNTSEITELMDSFSSLVESAREKHALAADKWKEALALRTSNETDREAIHTLVREARDLMKEAQHDLKEAHGVLKEIQKEVRESGGQLGACADNDAGLSEDEETVVVEEPEDEDDDASEDSSESDDSEDDAAEETDDSEESEDTTEDETDEESGEDETAENESGEDGVDVNVTVEASV